MRGNEDYKNGGKLGQGVGALKRGGGLEPPYELWLYGGMHNILDAVPEMKSLTDINKTLVGMAWYFLSLVHRNIATELFILTKI